MKSCKKMSFTSRIPSTCAQVLQKTAQELFSWWTCGIRTWLQPKDRLWTTSSPLAAEEEQQWAKGQIFPLYQQNESSAKGKTRVWRERRSLPVVQYTYLYSHFPSWHCFSRDFDVPSLLYIISVYRPPRVLTIAKTCCWTVLETKPSRRSYNLAAGSHYNQYHYTWQSIAHGNALCFCFLPSLVTKARWDCTYRKHSRMFGLYIFTEVRLTEAKLNSRKTGTCCRHRRFDICCKDAWIYGRDVMRSELKHYQLFV